MSKESYMRGFCKAAAAAGVDPVKLAKYANTNNVSVASQPKYKTDGWAPPVVASLGTSVAPMYGYDDSWTQSPDNGKKDVLTLDERAAPIESLEDLVSARMLLEPEGLPNGDISRYTIRPRAAIDPRYAAWLNSHTKALDQISSAIYRDLPFNDLSPKERQSILGARNPSLAESIAKAYHDSMAKSTGAVSRVSAPVKK